MNKLIKKLGMWMVLVFILSLSLGAVTAITTPPSGCTWRNGNECSPSTAAVGVKSIGIGEAGGGIRVYCCVFTNLATDICLPPLPANADEGVTCPEDYVVKKIGWDGDDSLMLTCCKANVEWKIAMTGWSSRYDIFSSGNNCTKREMRDMLIGVQLRANDQKLNLKCADICVKSTEVCDNKDNDCDGSVDEGLTRGQTCGVGECFNLTVQTCSAGAWSPPCTPKSGQAATEICDGKDNDCDGSVDENLSAITQTCGVGECSRSINKTCSEISLNPCTPGTPTAEVCDNLDNDCDGAIDNINDTDNDNYTVCQGDCDDSDPEITPGAGDAAFGDYIKSIKGLPVRFTVKLKNVDSSGILLSSWDFGYGSPLASNDFASMEEIIFEYPRPGKYEYSFMIIDKDLRIDSSEGSITVEGMGKCEPCNNINQCKAGLVCMGDGFCDVSTCDDKKKGPEEADVDCGGVCVSKDKKCIDGKKCSANADCTSEICSGNICAPLPTCTDGLKNQDETDVDCGGAICGKCYRGYNFVFVTSGTWQGNLGGLSGADAKCQQEANAAGLTGTYVAWLSGGFGVGDARNRIIEAAFRLTDGTTIIANSKYDLVDGTIQNLINVGANKPAVISGSVWTGTGSDGKSVDSGSNCKIWASSKEYEPGGGGGWFDRVWGRSKSSGSRGAVGSTSGKGAAWTFKNRVSCDQPARLYCFENSTIS